MSDRGSPAERERHRAVVRGLHLNELQEAGQARAAAVAQAEHQLDRIARLLPDALAGGLSLAEVARITGVSRPTLYDLRARYGMSANPELAFLQSVATRGSTTVAELADHLRADAAETTQRANHFAEQGFVELDVDEGPAGVQQLLYITPAGINLLEHWQFEEAEAGEEA